MKVKKDLIGEGQGPNQKPASLPFLSKNEPQNPTNTTIQRQVSLDPEDLNVNFVDLMNDPQFFNMMQSYYPPQGAGNPYVDQYPSSSTQYPVQYPGGQYGNSSTYFPMDFLMDDDDDDEDDEEFLMSMNSQPFQPKSVGLTKAVRNTTKPVRNTAITPIVKHKLKRAEPHSATSSVAHSPHSVAQSLLSQDMNSVTTNSPHSSVQDISDKLTSFAPNEAAMLDSVSNVQVTERDSSVGQSQHIADMHSYSLPVATGALTPPVHSQTIVYTDASALIDDRALPIVEVVATELEGSSLVPMDVTQTFMNTSPDSVDNLTSSFFAPVVVPATSPKSKSRKSSASRNKTAPTSSITARKKKLKDAITYTPPETISHILGDKIEENEIFKDVITKPIKHQAGINVEKAHDRSVKNAINARVNRQKHKQFVHTLEGENSQLREKIDDLEQVTDQLRTEKDVLQQEIRYLKSVLANESTIGNVLRGLTEVKDVRLSSGFAKQYRKRAADSTVDDNEDKNHTSRDVTAGVCLHVHSGSVSVEFCEKCANMAASGRP